MESLEKIFGWSGTLINAIYYISPLIPYMDLVKGKLEYDDVPGILVSTSYCNCFMWYIYGDMIFSSELKMCNLFGCLISLIFIMLYLIFEMKKFACDAVLNGLILFSGTWATYRALNVVVNDEDAVGKFCVISSLITHLSTIQLLFRVCKENNFRIIPIVTSFVLALSNICWIIYGFIINDYYIVTANFIGLGINGFIIGIYYIFKRVYPNEIINLKNIGGEEVSMKENNTRIDFEEGITDSESKVKVTDENKQ